MTSFAYAKNCIYSADPNSLVVEWAAFKTTQKATVPGKFTSAKNLKKLEKSYTSLPALLKAMAVEVDMTSVDTKDPRRDATLKEMFFKVLKGKGVASASLTQIKEKPEGSGTASMVLKFNDQTKRIPVTFNMDSEGNVMLKGQMDILNFTAHEALESLNKACHELHKGPDGVSKTWSEVNFTISGKVAKLCK